MCKPSNQPSRRVRDSMMHNNVCPSSTKGRGSPYQSKDPHFVISGRVIFLACVIFSIVHLLFVATMISRDIPVSRSLLRNSAHYPDSAVSLQGGSKKNSIQRLDARQGVRPRELTRIVISCNMAFEQDMLNWWALCEKSNLCPNRGASPVSRSSEVILYAEDEALYQKYRSSTRMTVRRSWETDTKFQNIDLSGSGRFHIRNDGFKELVSRRPALLLRELERAAMEEHARGDVSIMVLFIDLDALIRKDPRPYITGDYDMWAADAKSDRSLYNSGFMALRPTKNAIDLIRSWKAKMESSETANVNQISLEKAVEEADAAGTLKHHLLDDAQFPVGKGYPQVPDPSDKELWSKFDPSTATPASLGPDVVVFHNNWCHTICSKPHRAKAFGLWIPLAVEDVM